MLLKTFASFAVSAFSSGCEEALSCSFYCKKVWRILYLHLSDESADFFWGLFISSTAILPAIASLRPSPLPLILLSKPHFLHSVCAYIITSKSTGQVLQAFPFLLFTSHLSVHIPRYHYVMQHLVKPSHLPPTYSGIIVLSSHSFRVVSHSNWTTHNVTLLQTPCWSKPLSDHCLAYLMWNLHLSHR